MSTYWVRPLGIVDPDIGKMHVQHPFTREVMCNEIPVAFTLPIGNVELSDPRMCIICIETYNAQRGTQYPDDPGTPWHRRENGDSGKGKPGEPRQPEPPTGEVRNR